MDFTLKTYKKLLLILQQNNYDFLTLEQYFSLAQTSPRPVSPSPSHSFVILRHDVDRRPGNALKMAKLENELGIKASYYFRVREIRHKTEIITKIKNLDHEIGYHYEDLAKSSKKYKVKSRKYKGKREEGEGNREKDKVKSIKDKGNRDWGIGNEEKYQVKSIKDKGNREWGIGNGKRQLDPEIKALFKTAWEEFQAHLNLLRRIYPVKTIAMHGSPLSRWDNRLLWQVYDYKKLELLGEPYFDLDFEIFVYFTDAGRSWNNKFNIRDRIKEINSTLNKTNELILKIEMGDFPFHSLINIHPENWSSNLHQWVYNYINRGIRNYIKSLFVKFISN